MPGTAQLRLRDGDEARLRVLAAAPGARALRARAVLMAAEHGTTTAIARELGVSRQSVVSWRARYQESGIEGLADLRRSGRPAIIDSWVPVLAAVEAASDGRPWTSRRLGTHLGIGAATVARAWRTHGLTPAGSGHAIRLASAPPLLVADVDVVGIYAGGRYGVTAFKRRANAGRSPRSVGGGGADSVEAAKQLLAEAERMGVDLEQLREFVRAHEDCELLVTPAVGTLGAHRTASLPMWRSLTTILVALHCRTSEAEISLERPPRLLGRAGERPRSSESPTGGSGATMRDVAADAGVSVKTVSNVLTGAKPVAGATRARVESAIERLGYRVNTAARHLRTGRRGAVVVGVPEFRVSYFAELTERLIDQGAARGIDILVQVTRGQREKELATIHRARSRADGVIMAAHGMSGSDLQDLSESEPLVLIGENVTGSAVDRITISNADAAYVATSHLLRSGLRRIALLGIASSPVAEARLRGCRSAALEYGTTLAGDLLLEASPWHRDAGERVMSELLASGTVPEGVVAFNDELALGASRALQSRGLKVPGDVALVGFDNSSDAAYATPSITSIAPDLDYIARRALDLIVEWPERSRETSQQAVREVAPFSLMVRESAP